MKIVRRGRSYWLPIIADFESTEYSHEEFCREHELNRGTFRRWLFRLRTEGVTTGPAFVEVIAADHRPRDRDAYVLRLGQAELGFSALPEAEYLATLVGAVEVTSR
jgi:hypothetical protein